MGGRHAAEELGYTNVGQRARDARGDVECHGALHHVPGIAVQQILEASLAIRSNPTQKLERQERESIGHRLANCVVVAVGE